MLIGVPKEIKNHEYRIGMTPESVAETRYHGHSVIIESGAGLGIRRWNAKSYAPNKFYSPICIWHPIQSKPKI